MCQRKGESSYYLVTHRRRRKSSPMLWQSMQPCFCRHVQSGTERREPACVTDCSSIVSEHILPSSFKELYTFRFTRGTRTFALS